MKVKKRMAKRIKGLTRKPLYSGYLPRLEDAVKRTARQFNCSRSLVIVTAVADALGVDIEEDPLQAPNGTILKGQPAVTWR